MSEDGYYDPLLAAAQYRAGLNMAIQALCLLRFDGASDSIEDEQLNDKLIVRLVEFLDAGDEALGP
jgi:hypothetical protein